MKTRALVAALAVAAVLLAGCGSDDDGDEAETTEPSVEETSTSAGDDGAETATSAVDDGAEDTAMEGDDDVVLAALCETFESDRQGSEVTALMTADAVVMDHTAGETYEGTEAIATWVDEYPGMVTFDQTTCGTESVGRDGVVAGTYAFSSTTEEGGTEGVGVAYVEDGAISEFHVHYTPVEGDPVAATEVSDEEVQLVGDYCEAWGSGDTAAVTAVVSDDWTMSAEAGEFEGADGVASAMALLETYDGVECDEGLIGNGGFLVGASAFVDSDAGTEWGGVEVMTVADGVVTTHVVHHVTVETAES